MKDINLGQFVSKFFSYSFTQKPPAAADNINMQPKFAPEKQANTQEIIARQLFNLNQDINLTRAQLAQLSNLDKNLLLKDFFNLPRELKDFLMLMSGNGTKDLNGKAIADMLMNSTLDLSRLMLFIQQNGKEALSKLFQMVANYNQIGASVKQNELSELTALINACVATAGEKNSNALKTIMLMYLPWLPLNDKEAFKLEIGKENGAGGSLDDSITILISTVNFGNVHVMLSKSDKGSIQINITCSKGFPVEKFKIAMNEESVNHSVQTMISTSIVDDSENKMQENQTKISMNVSPGVNPFLILMANSVIKTVMTIDNSDNLRQTRKEML